jgi:hypothetical protein
MQKIRRTGILLKETHAWHAYSGQANVLPLVAIHAVSTAVSSQRASLAQSSTRGVQFTRDGQSAGLIPLLPNTEPDVNEEPQFRAEAELQL